MVTERRERQNLRSPRRVRAKDIYVGQGNYTSETRREKKGNKDGLAGSIVTWGTFPRQR